MTKSGIKARSGGFSLIEVLIAMLILSFGVLSMGGLQLAALKSNQIAGNMSLAATLAKDYSEMMRSNWGLSSTTTVSANPYLFDTSVSSSFTATPSTTCGASTCNVSQMATLHVADWAQRVASQLPGGRAVVCRDLTPRNSDGTYRWSCSNGTSTAVVSPVTIKIGWVDKREQVERGTTTMSVTAPNPQFVMTGFTGYAE